MRSAFVDSLIKLAEKNDRIFLLTGDLGYGVLESFQEKFPERFLNVGVAEQNMIGIAAGLALSGKLPIVYSIATFASLRPYEFIRNDVCYQNLNVKIVGVGAGLSYPQYAATHQAIDDVGAMRALPNLVILNPGDPVEARLAAEAMMEHSGPVYLRIGKRGEPIIHKTMPEFEIGKSILLRDGKDLTVIATGGILENSAKAVELLAKEGFAVRFLSFPTIRPVDREAILESAKKTGALFVVEENFESGGLGSEVAEVLAANGVATKFKKIALPHRFPKEIGSQNYIRGLYGLLPEQIAGTIKDFLKK
jgi:transketolase